jgi:hypothetical protein
MAAAIVIIIILRISVSPFFALNVGGALCPDFIRLILGVLSKGHTNEAEFTDLVLETAVMFGKKKALRAA